jgi:hypothetical protein
LDRTVEEKMMEFMRPLFGDMARKTIETQKEKLELTKGELTYEQYIKIIEAIRVLCMKMAGPGIAENIRKGLVKILDDEKASG